MLTTPQRKALERLHVVLLQTRPIPHDRHGNIKTGCNTTALYGLRSIGAISCSVVYLRGYVSPDIKINHRLEGF